MMYYSTIAPQESYPVSMRNGHDLQRTTNAVTFSATRETHLRGTHLIVLPYKADRITSNPRHRNMESDSETTKPSTDPPHIGRTSEVVAYSVLMVLLMTIVCMLIKCKMSNSCDTDEAQVRSDDSRQEPAATRILKKKMILEKIEKCKMVVQKGDLVLNDEDVMSTRTVATETDAVEAKPQFLALPDEIDSENLSSTVLSMSLSDASNHSTTTQQQQHHERMIPNNCVICLEAYNPGETVVWSVNPRCLHAFHEECILNWLVVKQEPSCPCCRCNFLTPGTDGEQQSTEVSNTGETDTNDDGIKTENASRAVGSLLSSVAVNVEPVHQEADARSVVRRSYHQPRRIVSFSVQRDSGIRGSNVTGNFVYDIFPSSHESSL